MTTSRAVSPSSQTRQWSDLGDERLRTRSLADTANQSSSSPASPRSATRALADRSSERRLRSATADSLLNVPDLPIELSCDVIDLLDISAIVKLSTINREFYQLTAPIRNDYRNAHASKPRLNQLKTLSSDPHRRAETGGGNTHLALISSPRFDEFNSLLGLVNQMHHAEPKTMVLNPLADLIPVLSAGEQRVKAFTDISVAARSLHNSWRASGSRPAEWHAQVLTSLAKVFDHLPQGKDRLDAVNGLLKAVHTLPGKHRVAVLTTLARKLNALIEDQPIIDIGNRIIAETAELDAVDRELGLMQLAGTVRGLPSDQSRFDIYRAALVAAEELPADHRKLILLLLANNVDALPEGPARTVALNRVLYATTQIPAADRSAVLKPLAKNVGLLEEGQPRTFAFNGILRASTQIPDKFRVVVLQPLAENIEHLDEGQLRTDALNAVLRANTDIPIWDKHCVLKELALGLILFEEGQPIIDALNSILEAVKQIPADQKSEVLLPLALSAHTLPELESIDAFKHVMGEAATMDAQAISLLLGKFLALESRFARTPRQMIGELNELIALTVDLSPKSKGVILKWLTAHLGYRGLDGGHSIDAFSRILAMTTNVSPDSMHGAVVWNLGDWVANLPVGQMIGAAHKLVAQVETQMSNNNKTFVLNKITDPDLFIRVLPKGHVEGVFTAMLNAVVNLPSNEKGIALSNLAKSIQWLPDDEKIAAFKAVAVATTDISLNKSRADVLKEMRDQIRHIPASFKFDAHQAIVDQAK